MLIKIKCNTDGIITSYSDSNSDFLFDINIGSLFVNIFARSSMSNALDFLVEIKTYGEFIGKRLEFLHGIKADFLNFSGILLKDCIYIVGSTSILNEEDIYYYFDISPEVHGANVFFSPFLNGDGNSVLNDTSLFNEITKLNNQLIATQRELAKKNFELTELNKLKNHFLGMAAHDLLNPLGQIMNYAELVSFNSTASTKKNGEYLGRISHLSNYMIQLVHDFLDISSIESGHFEFVKEEYNLVDVVEEILDINQQVAMKKGIEIKFNFSTPDIYILLDKNKVQQVLNNLISNSIKFSMPAKLIQIDLTEHNNYVEIAIQDQGVGISASEMESLFQPFSHNKKKTTGGESSTGLGLAIVKKIIEGHGGVIFVKSEPNLGSVFTFRIPKHKKS